MLFTGEEADGVTVFLTVPGKLTGRLGAVIFVFGGDVTFGFDTGAFARARIF